MAQVDTLDLIVLIALLLGSVAYFTKGTYWAVAKDPYAQAALNSGPSNKGTRNIIEKMEESKKNCVVFYGSQTGTAEDYASRLAKEGSSRFGLKTMTADLEDYDYENLNQFPNDKIAFFVMATYGEGEPTDNAVEFWDFINTDTPSFAEDSEDKPLSNLKYVTFGLGNNTYEHYNSMVRGLDKLFQKFGAKRIGDAGEGDDGAGTMEEDFLAWKEPMWKSLQEEMGLEEREASYEPAFSVDEKPDMHKDDPNVYLGELNKNYLEGTERAPFNASNPYIAPLVESKELFTTKGRNCLHVEIDVSGGSVNYTTGDHVAVWPTNPSSEVDRFIKAFGMEDKRHNVIAVKGLDPTAKVPFPTPTTYEAAVRYHMEICAPVSRQFMDTLAEFAPNEDAKKEMKKIGTDPDYFKEKVANQYYNIAQAVASVNEGPWDKVPFSCLIEGLHKIQVRYYSISSSNLVQPKKISITAVVASNRVPGSGNVVKGVTTNYLLALKQKQNGHEDPTPHGLKYEIEGPRNKYDGLRVPIHVRHSNFKLPSDPSKPIIMVGPGSGVAPFRGFVMERAEQAKRGDNIGETVLFYGCRKSSEDWLYREEWESFKSIMGDKLTIFNAFSREDPKHKHYVQHDLAKNGPLVNDLLKKKANFYVCGDAAHMARDVNETLAQIIEKERGVSKEKAEQTVKSMRSSGIYQEDVWS